MVLHKLDWKIGKYAWAAVSDPHKVNLVRPAQCWASENSPEILLTLQKGRGVELTAKFLL